MSDRSKRGLPAGNQTHENRSHIAKRDGSPDPKPDASVPKTPWEQLWTEMTPLPPDDPLWGQGFGVATRQRVRRCQGTRDD